MGFLALGGGEACKRELAPEIVALHQMPDSASMAVEEEEIHALAGRYETAFGTGQIDRLLYYYTDGAAEIEYNGHVWSAEDGLSELFSELPDGARVSIDSQYTVIGSAGDVAYDVGRYTVESITEEGEQNETYRYMTGLKKVDGEWKIDLMMISAAMEEEHAEEPRDGADADST
jgi:ketosteroid isomerase-like protein